VLAGFLHALQHRADGVNHLLQGEHGDAVKQVDIEHAFAAGQVFDQVVETRNQ
jgi:hypothetical protein